MPASPPNLSPAGAMASRPLVLASNRLPLRAVQHEGAGLVLEPSAGGLVAALSGIEVPRTWVGWPGAVVPAGQQEQLRSLLARDGLRPVLLGREAEDGYYHRTCNELLWPLFHEHAAGESSRPPFDPRAWAAYVAVNERFADELDACSPPGATVWIHDLHLMLVPAALRRRRPDVAIGFFLHVPFPSSGRLELLPTRAELLAGLLGADCVGFHTPGDAHRFRAACRQVMGAPGSGAGLVHGGRHVTLAALPGGVDAARFRRLLGEPATQAASAVLDRRWGGRALVLGVDRLDATKGIPQKLRAFERYLEAAPERAGGTVLLQVVVPSRQRSAASRLLRTEIDELAARVNARFGTRGALPVECVHGTVAPSALAALYRRADVMAVTPLHDGMNLVAQEFVVCQPGGAAPAGWEPSGRAPGVLVLGRRAGAAQSLRGALLVDPRDCADLAAGLAQALALPVAERRRRQALMARSVEQLEAPLWAERFLACLARAACRVEAA